MRGESTTFQPADVERSLNEFLEIEREDLVRRLEAASARLGELELSAGEVLRLPLVATLEQHLRQPAAALQAEFPGSAPLQDLRCHRY